MQDVYPELAMDDVTIASITLRILSEAYARALVHLSCCSQHCVLRLLISETGQILLYICSH